MRASGVRGLLVYCSDYHCSHWTAVSGDGWPNGRRDVKKFVLKKPRFCCPLEGLGRSHVGSLLKVLCEFRAGTPDNRNT
jgi:hypothetical protein